MGNKLFKIGNDVSYPKLGEKINIAHGCLTRQVKSCFLDRCSDRPSFMQFGIVHLHILLLSSVGALLPPEKGKTEHFDSNCIRPVSVIV